jgi:predicted HAD superfamily Cof-like phosphohydrolase
MNEAFGNSSGVAVGDNPRLRRQCAGVASEVDELEVALSQPVTDHVAIADALCDILVFAYGAFHILGQKPASVVLGRTDLLALQVNGLRHQSMALTFGTMSDPVDLEQVCGTLNDTIALVRSYFTHMGWNVDEMMHRVFESNMSKFCATQEEVDATIAKYDALGVHTYVEGEFPAKCLKVAQDCKASDGTDFFKGKFLKGVNFEEPALGDLV